MQQIKVWMWRKKQILQHLCRINGLWGRGEIFLFWAPLSRNREFSFGAAAEMTQRSRYRYRAQQSSRGDSAKDQIGSNQFCQWGVKAASLLVQCSPWTSFVPRLQHADAQMNKHFLQTQTLYVYVFVSVCLSVSVCVREREIKRENGDEGGERLFLDVYMS